MNSWWPEHQISSIVCGLLSKVDILPSSSWLLVVPKKNFTATSLGEWLACWITHFKRKVILFVFTGHELCVRMHTEWFVVMFLTTRQQSPLDDFLCCWREVIQLSKQLEDVYCHSCRFCCICCLYVTSRWVHFFKCEKSINTESGFSFQGPSLLSLRWWTPQPAPLPQYY